MFPAVTMSEHIQGKKLFDEAVMKVYHSFLKKAQLEFNEKSGVDISFTIDMELWKTKKNQSNPGYLWYPSEVHLTPGETECCRNIEMHGVMSETLQYHLLQWMQRRSLDISTYL